jgi:hypothetical protein
MKEISPSPNFVENVMAELYRSETKEYRPFTASAIGTIIVHAGTAVAVLIGIVNCIRLFASVYAPIACR